MADLFGWRVVIASTQLHDTDLVWRTDDQGEPTVSSNGDPIDTEKSRIVETRISNEIKIKEENVKTGGGFSFGQVHFPIPANQTVTEINTWPIPISIAAATVMTNEAMTGDSVSLCVAPNTTIGAAVADISISDTVITASPTVFDYIKIGYYVRIASASDPTNTYEDVGRVLEVDSDNYTITIETPATMNWTFATGVLIQMTVYFVKDFIIAHPGAVRMGAATIGASYLPANTPLVCTYTNNSVLTPKIFAAYIEFLY